MKNHIPNGIQCRFLVETHTGALVQCERITPNNLTELCTTHIAKVLRSVRDSAGKGAPRVFLEALT